MLRTSYKLESSRETLANSRRMSVWMMLKVIIWTKVIGLQGMDKLLVISDKYLCCITFRYCVLTNWFFLLYHMTRKQCEKIPSLLFCLNKMEIIWSDLMSFQERKVTLFATLMGLVQTRTLCSLGSAKDLWILQYSGI